MNNRRDFASVLALGLLGAPNISQAQAPQRLPVVGVLYNPAARVLVRSLDRTLQGLRDLGYEEGKNFSLELRFAAGKPAAFPGFAAELVQRKADVIYAQGPAAVKAAWAATRVIPIVAYDLETDPVQAGWARSLARPGGNLTGLFLDNAALAGKWVELLRAAAPAVRRIGLLWDSSTGTGQLVAAKAAAQGFGIETNVMEVRSVDDIEAALKAGIGAGIHAIVVLGSPTFNGLAVSTKLITDFAANNRLPTITQSKSRSFRDGLMSYGASEAYLWRQAGVLIGKILNGAKPGDLAIELPTRFEFVINLKTAKALGITIPQSLLLRADEVIQ